MFVAIREDRTRGGRSTYQCSYTLPANLVTPPGSDTSNHKLLAPSGDPQVKLEAPDVGVIAGSSGNGNGGTGPVNSRHLEKLAVPQLLQVSYMPLKHYTQGKQHSNMLYSDQSIPCLFSYMAQKCGHIASEMQEDCRRNTQDSCEVLRNERERIKLRTFSMIVR